MRKSMLLLFAASLALCWPAQFRAAPQPVNSAAGKTADMAKLRGRVVNRQRRLIFNNDGGDIAFANS